MYDNIEDITFSVLDIETTGLSVENGDKIIEIGAVKIEPGLCLNTSNSFTSLINPEQPIPYSSYKIHNIDDSMVADSPRAFEILPEFSGFLKDSVIIAHNAKFDISFINYYMNSFDIKWDCSTVIDTLKLSRKVFPYLKKYNLDHLIKYFNIFITLQYSHRHRALYDALNTALLFLKCIDKIKFINNELSFDTLINLSI